MDSRVLRDSEKHSRARSARRYERGKRSRHRPLVMAYENSGLGRCHAQNRFVVKIVQTSRLGGLKIDPWLAAQGRVDDDPLQVVVRLKARLQDGDLTPRWLNAAGVR